ncbi:proton-conducting transporter membrane subunit [Pyrobaculum arsenaticum]|uniref:NADH/Ubiquinone/plastoquinone (Complex I) n=1 Tax=Pyrobaculum arsenaticum (strain DSM 13514 / JCM 11321 / PZ6) TaxID=340102 RepID=A4WN58_PYRAR|nr:proton-conducting transporter membrane subunit [Pyrobaculum arsenaticum]ABP51825.1 NADH/Ubiquinone/plastoquinone (complex I) [Pyrobaculum arsenaticum DSM 13514]
MMLELWLLVLALLALADLFTKKGIGSLVGGAATLYLSLTRSLMPATHLFHMGDLAHPLYIFISGIYTAIAAYSIWYASHLERRGWFWLWMGVFYTSMLTFVAADHWLVLITGWGGLDIASWALILTYHDGEKYGRVGPGGRAWGVAWEWAPSASALRAILTVEIGTASLAAGLAPAAAAQGPHISSLSAMSDLSAALVLTAAFVKAAQLPFTDWLMTAMSAPTPVSALLHSSTMVKAGPILLLKLGHAMPTWAAGTAFAFGIATALYGGVVALGQREPKVLLAASTASYLGLITAFALAKPEEALWLTYSHGVAKATLFMAVGHAIHIEHTTTPTRFPVAAKAAMGLALLTLVGLTPLGAVAKSNAEPWFLLFSFLTAGYVGKLMLKTATTPGGWAVAAPYTALAAASLAFPVLPNPFWALALAGLALAKTPEPTVLLRRLGLPVLYDAVAPAVFKAVRQAAAVGDGFVDKRLLSLEGLWRGLASLVAVVDLIFDMLLHDFVPALVQSASAQLSRRSFDYYLYVAGVGAGIILALAVLLWIH